jgi:hypothetical protein
MRHRVGKRNIAADVKTDPDVGPLRRAGATRIDDDKPRSIAQSFEDVVEEDRMRFACVRSP